MKQYHAILITWILITLISSMSFFGFNVFLTGFFAVFFILTKLFNVVFKKADKKEFFIKLSIIVMSYVIVLTVHYIRYQQARQYADSVVYQVLEYKKTYNTYPENSVVRIKDKNLSQGKVFYNLEKNEKEPYLIYMDTFMMYASYNYNFKTNKWEYHGD